MKTLKTLILIILALVTNTTYGQEVKKDFSIGVGFAPRYGLIDSRSADMVIPHITFNWDQNVAPDIGPGRITAGPYLGLSYYEGTALFTDGFLGLGGFGFVPADLFTLDIGVRGSYTLNPVLDEKLEPYGGLQYNYHLTFASAKDDAPNDLESEGEVFNGGDIGAFIGTRYLFSEHNSLFVELSPGYLLWRVGLTFKKFR
ncbi:MAG: hypothetical protein AAFN93_26255 [Bacteroidota bacterium]